MPFALVFFAVGLDPAALASLSAAFAVTIAGGHGGVIGTYGWVWSIATTGQIALDSGWVAQKTECSVAKEKKQTAGLQLSEDLVAVAGTCLGDQRWVLREKRELEGPEDRGERDAVGCWFLDDGVTER